jgi:hypothetical protein
MAKQVIQIEVDVPEGFSLGRNEVLDRQAPYIGGKYDYLLGVTFTKVEPVRESRWLNIHGKDSIGHMRSDKSKCDFHEHPAGRAGLIRLEFAGDDLVSATVEGVE